MLATALMSQYDMLLQELFGEKRIAGHVRQGTIGFCHKSGVIRDGVANA